MKIFKSLSAIALAAVIAFASAVPSVASDVKPQNTETKVNKSLTKAEKTLLKGMFDAKWYGTYYPDVVKVLGDDEKALFNHFLEYGLWETRQPNEAFNVNAYATGYKDLNDAFGNNVMAYYKHYDKFGKSEGRDCITIEKALDKVGFVKSVSPLTKPESGESVYGKVFAEKKSEPVTSNASARVLGVDELVEELFNITYPRLFNVINGIEDENSREEAMSGYIAITPNDMDNFTSRLKDYLGNEKYYELLGFTETEEEALENVYMAKIFEAPEIAKVRNYIYSLNIIPYDESGAGTTADYKNNYLSPIKTQIETYAQPIINGLKYDISKAMIGIAVTKTLDEITGIH